MATINHWMIVHGNLLSVISFAIGSFIAVFEERWWRRLTSDGKISEMKNRRLCWYMIAICLWLTVWFAVHPLLYTTVHVTR